MTTERFSRSELECGPGMMLPVPYKGSAPAQKDLIGGQIPLSFDTNGAAIPQIEADKVKAIAVTSAGPTPSMPGVPSIACAG